MEKLTEEINKMVAAGFDYNEIMSSLISEGYKPAEVSDAIEQINESIADDYQEKNPVLSNVYLPFVLAALVFALFFFIIPDTTFARYNIFFTLVGAFSFAGFLAWGLFQFALRNVKKYPWMDNSPVAIIIGSVVAMFIFGGFLISRGVNVEHDELVKFGVLAEATVQDGKIYKSRRSSTASVTAAFYTEQGARTAKVDVSSGNFDSYYKGQRIIVLYSEKHPDIVTEINHKSHIEYYKLENKILDFQQKINNENL